MLDNNSYRVVKFLLDSHTYCTIDMISETLSMSKRSIYYSINTINSILETNGIEKIVSKRYYGVLLTYNIREFLVDQLDKVSSVNQIYLTEYERLAMIVCGLYKKQASLDELGVLCGVSVRTIQEDIKTLEKRLKVFRITIEPQRNHGYYLKGNELHVRTAVMYYLDIVIGLLEQNMIEDKWFKYLQPLERKISIIEQESQLVLKLHVVQKLAFIIGSSREVRKSFDTYHQEVIDHPVFKIVDKELGSYSYDEKYYTTMILISARLAKLDPYFYKKNSERDELIKLVDDMIHTYEEIGRVTFSEKQNLKDSLIQHLYFSTKLYNYGIIEVNPLKEEIQLEYTSVYSLTELILKRMNSSLKFPITRDEIAYITLLFGSHLDLAYGRMIKLLVVCVSGVSTSLMIKQEILNMDNKVEVVSNISSDEVDKYEDAVDLIISTVKIETSKPVIYVNPVFSSVDRTRVLHGIESIKEEISTERNFSGLYQEIFQYIVPGKESLVHDALQKFEKSKRIKTQINREISILDILDELTFNHFDKDTRWYESIELTGSELVSKGLIKSSYLSACINAIKDNGAYSIFPNKMYLAHAKPEDGVRKLSLAIGVFEKGVIYPKEVEVEFVVILATTDFNSHIKVLNQIVQLFSDVSFIKGIKNIKQNKEEFIKLIGRYIK